MKKSFVVLILCTLFIQGADLYAQNPANMALLESTTPEERANIQTELLRDKLTLTESQQDKVAEVNLKYAKQMEEMIKGGASKWKMYRTAIRVDKEKDGDLKALLTAPQFSTYLDYKEHLRTDGKEKLLRLREEKSQAK